MAAEQGIVMMNEKLRFSKKNPEMIYVLIKFQTNHFTHYILLVFFIFDELYFLQKLQAHPSSEMGYILVLSIYQFPCSL